MHLIQVCNVGRICGGTAACAWTIARAFPEFQHTVLFLSRTDAETRATFAFAKIAEVSHVDDAMVRARAGDLVILHNVAPHSVERIRCCPAIQYVHSLGTRAEADVQVACSEWLAARLPGRVPVLYQPVPVPAALESSEFTGRDTESLVVGRLCTPTARKWPQQLVEFYGELIDQIPGIRWEFVGMPNAMQLQFRALGEQVRFLPAGWNARSHLRRWDVMLYHHPTLAETFGRTVAEALRAGCVPVVDRRGGFLEQIDPGCTGYLCEKLGDFAQALSALKDGQLRHKLANAAREAADARNSYSAFRRQLASLLEQGGYSEMSTVSAHS